MKRMGDVTFKLKNTDSLYKYAHSFNTGQAVECHAPGLPTFHGKVISITSGSAGIGGSLAEPEITVRVCPPYPGMVDVTTHSDQIPRYIAGCRGRRSRVLDENNIVLDVGHPIALNRRKAEGLVNVVIYESVAVFVKEVGSHDWRFSGTMIFSNTSFSGHKLRLPIGGYLIRAMRLSDYEQNKWNEEAAMMFLMDKKCQACGTLVNYYNANDTQHQVTFESRRSAIPDPAQPHDSVWDMYIPGPLEHVFHIQKCDQPKSHGTNSLSKRAHSYEYRADTIARTEAAFAYNATYAEAARQRLKDLSVEYLTFDDTACLDSMISATSAAKLADDLLQMYAAPLTVPDANFRCHSGRDITKESATMKKIYEALVIETDTKTGEIAKILKVVPPFLAASVRAAQDAVLVDYTRENTGVTGEELAGISVRVREFLGATS